MELQFDDDRRELMPDLDDLGRHYDDDPATFDARRLEMMPTSELMPEDSDGYHVDAYGVMTNGLIIPFKTFGQFRTAHYYAGRLYGTVGSRDEVLISYGIARDLWNRCPSGYPLCYTQGQRRQMELFNFRGGGNLDALTDDGLTILKTLCDPSVSADDVVKAFNLIGLKIEGKLVKVKAGGWYLNNKWLDVDLLLMANQGTSE